MAVPWATGNDGDNEAVVGYKIATKDGEGGAGAGAAPKPYFLQLVRPPPVCARNACARVCMRVF